jgi:hypothetical protein
MDDLVVLLAEHGATVKPSGSDPADVWATAVQYRAVGHEQSQRGDKTAALENYRRAGEHFQKASEGYQVAAEKLRSRAFRTKVKGWTGVVLLSLATAANAANAYQQAETQAHQMAQYDALRKAAGGQPGTGHGVGYATYIVPNYGSYIDGFQKKASLLDEIASKFEMRAKKSATNAADCRREEGCP